MKLFIIVLIIYFSSANATPEFEGRGGEELASEISNMLLRVYGCLDLQKLCIIPKQQCWVLYIDILVKIDLGNYCMLHTKTAGGHHGRNRMVVGFITTYGINAYHY